MQKEERSQFDATAAGGDEYDQFGEPRLPFCMAASQPLAPSRKTMLAPDSAKPRYKDNV